MSVPLTQRHLVEEEFHDGGNKGGGFLDFKYAPHVLRHADNYAIGLLDNVRGKRILEIGCGNGFYTLRFAGAGAEVAAFDISPARVAETRRRVLSRHLEHRVTVDVMSAEDMVYISQSFDLAFGHSVLHHLDLALASKEISRVLKPGGRGVFVEPLGQNPIIGLYRRLTPKRRTATEQPLNMKDIHSLKAFFPRVSHREFYFTALLVVAFWLALPTVPGSPKIMDILTRLDDFLLHHAPPMGRYCWVSVIQVEKGHPPSAIRETWG
ncbi:MAG: class I SAM-dependent methyltransferase [Chloroflexi bacterium]|nr:class I SAM-dependent methyltransferase [Chloroflexota bacterium]